MNRKTIVFLAYFTFICFASTLAQDNNYGVDEANTKFNLKEGVLGGDTLYDYLLLKDHIDVSGVPLGGIGVGNINLSPGGQFTRIGINNIHMPIKRSESSFFAIWSRQAGRTEAVRLVRDTNIRHGLRGVNHTQYTGLFPTVELSYRENGLAAEPVIRAYSGLVPHNIKDSSLPVVWFEIDLVSEQSGEVSLAFSWEDFIGLYRDPKNLNGFDFGQLLEGNRSQLSNGESWPLREKAATKVRDFQLANWKGIVQYATDSLTPRKMTFQNYVNQVVIAVEQNKDTEITCLPAFDKRDTTDIWKNFAINGTFGQSVTKDACLSPQSADGKASVIAAKTFLEAGKKKTLRFMLVWWAPEMHIDKAKAPKGSYWPYGADYNKYYHNYFGNMNALISYAVANRERIRKQTTEWHQPVMASSLPDWYKFKLINSGYVIYTNIVLNKKGDVMSNEGAMGGFGGTMDQRISSHPFYQKFFTDLDRSEMNIFADSMEPEGNILHFIGHYYVGIGTVGGRVPTEKGHMIDNSSGWIIQLTKDFEQTGDIGYLRSHITKVKQSIAFLHSCMPRGSRIPIGQTTYDDFSHPPLYSYYAGVWLTTLKAYEAIGEAINDKEIADYARRQFELSQREVIDKLWNGRYFAYGCEPDGSKRIDCILFTGQLAGQFLSRYCGWGDIYPLDMVKASLISQFKISLSQTPDYYANKVWDINLNRGIDNPGSQCWPFYLESYTALTGMQAGFYSDAMDIMKHIQLVHLRNGWTWTQNLWNPSDITYMTAPVTWFSTDVLAGAGINLPRRELRLAPIVQGNKKVVLPLYYPCFWGTLTADPATKELKLSITKTFGDNHVMLEKIISEHVGLPTTERKITNIPPFIVQEGKVLDLSHYWNEIVNCQLEAPVLPEASKHNFRYAKKQYH